MQEVHKTVLVPYSARQMFDLVDDVARYPEFLPWCGGTQVLDAQKCTKPARIDIDFHGVRAHFTTVNANETGKSIAMTLQDGPFRELHGEWTFRALSGKGCKIEFTLTYEFKTQVLEALIGPVFNHIADTFVDAFVRRADMVYAKAS